MEMVWQPHFQEQGGLQRSEERGKTYVAFDVQMSVPYSVRSEISEKRNIWGTQERNRSDLEKIVRAEESGID